jgi:valyl-tRNA synthetase
MDLPKTYEPSKYESDIYQLWESKRAFEPKESLLGDTYSIVIPPPNANANIHIGTAMTVMLEDIATRYHRMKGDKTLLLPGSDHAGFETQTVYEKKLAKEGKSRFDFNREELYSQIWDFVAQNKENFQKQVRGLGISCDWSRYTYTLDDHIVQQAYKTFKKMWDEGLIYRGERLVNFCTHHGTGFADIEVEFKEVAGNLWHISYPLTDGSGEIIVATTRPETMLGDVAVAVNPNDERYHEFIGKTVKLPLTEREIPIIADEFVDPSFGSGAVKITPAHDPTDFEVGNNHDLPIINVITHEGTISTAAPKKYQGLKILDARRTVVKDLTQANRLEKTEGYSHSVGHCYKCGTVIEPLVKEQWFVDMEPLGKKAIEALKADKIKFYPESKKHQLIKYLEGLRDWNISRQIVWGIPIPAFQNIDDPQDWVYSEEVSEEFIKIGDKTYRRDPDVFDTWFSSSSWPYATLKYPDNKDFKHFYPLSLMETGGEILYPWVSRMIMLGLYVTGEVPFESVYIHGYVMAEDGSKMSKSVGNVVDPLPLIDQYGSDALRMGLIAGRSPAVNRGYDPRKIEDSRNFCNKLWNTARFVASHMREHKHHDKPKPKTPADHWMLSRLQHYTELMTAHLEEYRFSEASEAVYHLLWDDFADWYIEASKSQPNLSVMQYSLATILKLAHPFAPFVTETIWQSNPACKGLLISQDWPKTTSFNKSDSEEFEQLKELISEIRFIKSSVGIQYGTILYHIGDELIKSNASLIAKMTQVEDVVIVEDGEGVFLKSTAKTAWLDIDRESAKSFLTTVEGKISEQEKVIENLEQRLSNKNYLEKAPKELVKDTEQQLKSARGELEKLKEEHSRFKV